MPTSQTSSPHLGHFQPRGTRRLIYVSDPSNTTSHLSVPAAKPEELRQIVRNYASAGSIDTLVQEIFAEAMTMFWRTDKCPYDIRHQHQRLVPIMDTGVMPVEVYIDECHKQGMEFIAGFRMNDRHGHHTEFFKKLYDEKPEWVLREYKPSTRRAPPESRKYGCSLNYAIPEVRAFLLDIMEEVANRFDIDGMEFNFTRLAECFPRAELSRSHSTMTGFIRQVRTMLDNARSPKGRDRNLILGVRVPQQMAGCKNLSLDVPTWIKEGLIDYVAPGDFGFTDFNEKYEDFVSIARQHDCYVYPQVQPRLSIDTEFLMDMPQYRAALQNFYAAGADGFSTQNYFFHWGPQFEPPGTNGAKIPAMYPAAMNDLVELKDPQSIGPDRHYTFRSLWANSKSLGEVYIKEELVLSRQKTGQRDTFRFRLCENLPSELIPSENTLTFFAQGLSKDDALTVDINGTKIPSQNLKWTWPDNDQPPSCTIALSNPPFIYGDNHLGLTIEKSAENIDGEIIVDHIECGIRSLSQTGDQ